MRAKSFAFKYFLYLVMLSIWWLRKRLIFEKQVLKWSFLVLEYHKSSYHTMRIYIYIYITLFWVDYSKTGYIYCINPSQNLAKRISQVITHIKHPMKYVISIYIQCFNTPMKYSNRITVNIYWQCYIKKTILHGTIATFSCMFQMIWNCNLW